MLISLQDRFSFSMEGKRSHNGIDTKVVYGFTSTNRMNVVVSGNNYKDIRPLQLQAVINQTHS